VVHGGGEQQPRGDLADDEQCGDRDHQREQRQRDGFRADSALDSADLCPFVRDKDLTPRRRKFPRERLCLVAEDGSGGARPEFDVRALEAHISHAEDVQQGAARHDEGSLVELGDGNDRTAGEDDANYSLFGA
jgi:hypothetical protein